MTLFKTLHYHLTIDKFVCKLKQETLKMTINYRRKSPHGIDHKNMTRVLR